METYLGYEEFLSAFFPWPPKDSEDSVDSEIKLKQKAVSENGICINSRNEE